MPDNLPILDYSTPLHPTSLSIDPAADHVAISYPPEPIWRPLIMIISLSIGLILLCAVLILLLSLARNVGGFSEWPPSARIAMAGILLGIAVKGAVIWFHIRRLTRSLRGVPSRIIHLTSAPLGGTPDPFEFGAERIIAVQVVTGPILANLRREFRLQVIDEENSSHILLSGHDEQELARYADQLRHALRLDSPS